MLDISINYDFLRKNTMENFFRYGGVTYLLLTIFAILLNKKDSPIATCFSVFLILLYSYFLHRLFHYIPKNFNVHTMFHHDTEGNKKSLFVRFTNLIIETVTDIFVFIYFYITKIIFNLNFVNNITIFYIGFWYVTFHIINYSLFHASDAHVKHHESDNSDDPDNKDKKVCNFSPDIFDHMFNTNCDNKHENMEHETINIIVAYFVTCVVFNKKVF